MSDPSLTKRLRQRSRRAGLAVGLSMALTIGVCIGSFAWIYAKVDPYTVDFVGSDATRVPPAAGRATSTSPAEVVETTDPGEAADPTEEIPPTPTNPPAPTPTSNAFRMTHVSNPDLQVNLRPRPSTEGEDVVAVLEAGTPLQYLNEQRTGDDGLQWFRFRTEDDLVGWMREGTFQEA
jgi:hypothetical protein